jgi:hypothetical protein
MLFLPHLNLRHLNEINPAPVTPIHIRNTDLLYPLFDALVNKQFFPLLSVFPHKGIRDFPRFPASSTTELFWRGGSKEMVWREILSSFLGTTDGLCDCFGRGEAWCDCVCVIGKVVWVVFVVCCC